MTSAQSHTPTLAPFLAFATDGQHVDTLKQFAAAHDWSDACVMQGDIGTAITHLKNHTAPLLLVVELPSAQEAPALLDALADVCAPETKVVATGTVNEYSFYCWLMDIGIFSYLLYPLSSGALENAYQKSIEPRAAASKEDRQPGKVIPIIGTRGGVGATTIALNLAGLAAELSGKEVALLDLDAQAGTVSLMLDIEPSRGIRDALERPDRIDSLFIERMVSRPMKHLSIISAEESLNERLNIHDHAADALLKELRAKFDIVILDIPRHLDMFSRHCLKQAEQLVVVTDMTLLALRDAMRIGDFAREALKIKQPLYIGNRIGLSAKQEIVAADFERGMNAKLAQRIPFAPELFMQLASDIPALKHKQHPAVKALMQLLEQLLPDVKIGATPPETKKFGLFKKRKAG